MLLLFQKQYEDDSFELSPIIISEYDWKINDYLQKLLKDSIDYDNKLSEHINKCKSIIKNYLIENYVAITGWRDVRAGVRTSFPITSEEKDRLIEFLCNNYNVGHDNSLILKYCDVNNLSRPYPKLPDPPKQPNPYYKKEWFYIKNIKCLDE